MLFQKHWSSLAHSPRPGWSLKVPRLATRMAGGLWRIVIKKSLSTKNIRYSAAGDPEFKNAINKIVALNPSAIVGHLRKASIGDLKLENTHPFVIEEWTFCHNGRIGGKGDMAGLKLNPAYSKKRKGETDSETFFLHLLQLLNGTANTNPSVIRKNLSDEINLIRNTRDYTAMNLILANGTSLFAVREVNEKNQLIEKENLCDYYYTLFMGKSADGKIKIICSQKLDLGGIAWEEIPNHMMVMIDMRTGDGEIVPV